VSEISQRTMEEIRAIAKGKGLVPFVPTSTELFLDIDKGCELNTKVLTAIRLNFPELISKGYLITKSKNGNRHLYLRCAFMSCDKRIAIQAALGSDPVKEALSIVRCVTGTGDTAIALFETPKEAKRVEAWRKKHADSGPKLKNINDEMYLTDDDIPF